MRTGFYQEIFGRPLANTVADIRRRLGVAVQAEDGAAHLRALLDLAFAELHMGSVAKAAEAANNAMVMAEQLGHSRDRAEAILWFSLCQHFSNDVSIATSFEDVAAEIGANALGTSFLLPPSLTRAKRFAVVKTAVQSS